MFFYTKLTSIKDLRPGHPEAGGVGKLTVERGKGGKKLWDAGKMKKRAPGLRNYSGEARMKRDGTLGDCFFSFAVAGTRNFLPNFCMSRNITSKHLIIISTQILYIYTKKMHNN